MDSHEQRYIIEESYSVLARQVLAADNLGDDVFLSSISSELMIPVGRIDSSNRLYDVKMALRDKLRLKVVVPALQHSTCCLACKYQCQSDAKVLTFCCSRTFITLACGIEQSSLTVGRHGKGFHVMCVDSQQCSNCTINIFTRFRGAVGRKWSAVEWISPPEMPKNRVPELRRKNSRKLTTLRPMYT
jgi:hypothetical protein